jgi:hypothetical protein
MSGSVKSIRHHQSFAGRDADEAHAQYLLASCGSLGNWDDAYDHSLVVTGNPHSVDFDELTGSMAHASLTDRDAVDAHTQYLRLAETADQTMSGNLKMSRKQILDVQEIKSCMSDCLSLYSLQSVQIDACKGFEIKTGNSSLTRAKFLSTGALDMYYNSITNVGHVISPSEASLFVHGCRFIHLHANDGLQFWVECDLVMEMCSSETTINDRLIVDGDLSVCGSMIGCYACIFCLEAGWLEVDTCSDRALMTLHNGCCVMGEGNQPGGFCAFIKFENWNTTCSHFSHYNIVKRNTCIDTDLCGYLKIDVGGQARWLKFFSDC